MEYLNIIMSSSLFQGIGEGEIEAVLSCLAAKTKEYKKGEFIFRNGDSVEAVGLLLSGNALIVQEDYWGNRNLISHISPAQLFAETFACSAGAVLNVSVEAASACEIMFLDIKRILSTCPSACSFHTRIIRNLLSDLANKNLRLNEKLSHMGKRSTKEKLLSYLSAQAIKSCSNEFDIPLNRQQLADYLSVDRSAMSNELCSLRDEGILSFEKNHFELYRLEVDKE